MTRRFEPQLGLATCVLAATTLFTPHVASAAAVDLYYERAVMSDADQLCRLFTPDLGAALASAQAQARGAALRSGVDAAVLTKVADRAQRRAVAVGCASPDVAKAAQRVRAAFETYSRLQKMSFPGDVAGWAADRATSRDVLRWRLSQTTDFGASKLTFGLASRANETGLVAVAGLAPGERPYAARLVMRDVTRAPEPFLARASGGRAALPSRLPPRSATVSVLAEAREPAASSLLPPGADHGVSFRFPASAAASLAELDPRETIAVELLFSTPSGRDEARTAYLELGDFAAGRAFLGAAQR
jgi:hypothetical protein